MKSAKRILIVLIALVCSVTLCSSRVELPKRFRVVVQGKIYRSSLPTVTELDCLAKEYSLRSIVMLSGDVTDRYQTLLDHIQNSDLRILHIPMTTGHTPSRTNVLRFLDFVETGSHQPLLICCGAGADRTGWMVMIYRIVSCNWELEDAVSEFRNAGGNYKEKRSLVKSIEKLALELRYARRKTTPDLNVTNNPSQATSRHGSGDVQFTVFHNVPDGERRVLAKSILHDFAATAQFVQVSAVPHPQLPTLSPDVLASLEIVRQAHDTNAMADLLALLFRYARAIEEHYDERGIILDQGNPLTKTFFQMFRATLVGDERMKEQEEVSTADFTQGIYVFRLKTGSSVSLDREIEECERAHRSALAAEFEQMAQEYTAQRSNAITVAEAKQIIADFAAQAQFEISTYGSRLFPAVPSNVIASLAVMLETDDVDYLADIAYFLLRHRISEVETYRGPSQLVNPNYPMVRTFATVLVPSARMIGPPASVLAEWICERRDKMGPSPRLDTAIAEYKELCRRARAAFEERRRQEKDLPPLRN